MSILSFLPKFNGNEILEIDGFMVYFRDSSSISYFSCENNGCFFGTNTMRDYHRHRLSCVEDTIINYAQKIYAEPIDKIKVELVSEKIIPSLSWENQFFSVFDIETGMSRDNEESINNLLMIHKLLSIGVTANFGSQQEFFLIRKDMNPDSLKILVEEFVKVLKNLRNDLFKVVPVSIVDGIAKYNDLVRTAVFKTMAVDEKANIYSKLSYLNDIFKLRCYSWNGGKEAISYFKIVAIMKTFFKCP